MGGTLGHRKIVCDWCGLIVRGSRGRLLACGMPAHCGSPMRWGDIEDAYQAGDDALRAHPQYEEDMRRWTRKARRDTRRVGAGPLRWGGCQRFIPATNHACGCGFSNDIRGGRNLGGWVEGAAFCRGWEEEQPF